FSVGSAEGGGYGGVAPGTSAVDPWGSTMGPTPESRGKTDIQTMVSENPLVQDAVLAAATGGIINKGTLKAIQATEGLSRSINANNQMRHILGTAPEGKGFLNSMDDA